MERTQAAQPARNWFVTVRTFNSAPLFGHVERGRMVLAPLGYLAVEVLGNLSRGRDGLCVEATALLPNHIHALLAVESAALAADPLRGYVGALKSTLARRGRQLQLHPSGLVWESRFSALPVRHAGALARIREYVAVNVEQWHADIENPRCESPAELYGWLAAYAEHLRG